jgi:hypothetical protein
MDKTADCAGDDEVAPKAVSVMSKVTPIAASVVAGAAVTIAICTGVGPRVAVITVSMIVSPIAVSVFAKGMDKTADCAEVDEVAPKAVSVMSEVTPISVCAGVTGPGVAVTTSSMMSETAVAVRTTVCVRVGTRAALIAVSVMYETEISPVAISVPAEAAKTAVVCSGIGTEVKAIAACVLSDKYIAVLPIVISVAHETAGKPVAVSVIATTAVAVSAGPVLAR